MQKENGYMFDDGAPAKPPHNPTGGNPPATGTEGKTVAEKVNNKMAALFKGTE